MEFGVEKCAKITFKKGKLTHIQNLVIDTILGLSAKLNKACYAIRAIKPYMSPSVLKTVYFSYFHSVMSYGIIFWCN